MASTDTPPSRTEKGKEKEEKEDKKEEENPLIAALPPATDYLTYLTILEYQLTAERLPTLHTLLQDETLTTNIGWDLVQLLLPLLPASQECLQDVARLGNPREVILRVSDALMKLEPSEDEDSAEEDESIDIAAKSQNLSLGEKEETEEEEEAKQLPLHILQLNSLLSMLVVLHQRIKTKHPSRFVSASLQAALEAYTTLPSDETTVSFLNFLRSLSSQKRPALPPRTTSDNQLAATASTAKEGTSAPDPEADDDGAQVVDEQPLIQRLLQFGLIEAVKTYILYCTDREPEGMQWALRLQEKFDPECTHSRMSHSQLFAAHWFLMERDRTIGKILALARDFGLSSQNLLQVILEREDEPPQPLDFEHLPESPDQIPLERHGCLLLLTARYASSVLFNYSTEDELNITVYPDLYTVIFNFLGPYNSPSDAVSEEPAALLDSLLSVALIAIHNDPAPTTKDETQLKQLVVALTACARSPSFRRISRLDQIPGQIFHAIPDPTTRFNVLHSIFADTEIVRFAHEPAIRWLKHELLSEESASSPTTTTKKLPFANPSSFAALFPHIYAPLPVPQQTLPLKSGSDTSYLHVFLSFVQTYDRIYLAALNMYKLLLMSSSLREKLQLDGNRGGDDSSEEKSFNERLRTEYLVPLKSLTDMLIDDEDAARGVENEMGGDSQLIDMAGQAAGVVRHVIGSVEEAMDLRSS